MDSTTKATTKASLASPNEIAITTMTITNTAITVPTIIIATVSNTSTTKTARTRTGAPCAVGEEGQPHRGAKEGHPSFFVLS